jgi:hypothetical protein
LLNFIGPYSSQLHSWEHQKKSESRWGKRGKEIKRGAGKRANDMGSVRVENAGKKGCYGKWKGGGLEKSPHRQHC